MKARRTHTGLRKLLARGGVWEIVKGKGRAVTAPPAWVWEGLATHAPDSARLACRAADASSAARYFEVSCQPSHTTSLLLLEGRCMASQVFLDLCVIKFMVAVWLEVN